ncbi:unnamed protein product [Paramecium pentaurelia]|uniref:Uncharacterized protein n=1 Tax=Paramecium pentaurelia TaxID=43138 RepID=A0A8S1UWZ5_9CILI|nr:unnamed protein product [Paramecium pentaurelia]
MQEILTKDPKQRIRIDEQWFVKYFEVQATDNQLRRLLMNLVNYNFSIQTIRSYSQITSFLFSFYKGIK